MSARFSVKRIPRADVRGIRNGDVLGGTAMDAYWYRIIDRATGVYVGNKHHDETLANHECEKLNTRT
ncbi:hypothetical protein D9M68_861040 [compost metagenome]|uniref:Uncharacterized protein n=1 Tax=Metapseudomonas resinovorans NBRC 106553 TaxID=1245471 RepID=S6AV22_METRE|nr:hypothetical protein [Pseudomonas resinovorans]BAN48266.1 hypothetical protein PCA10_25340 [Pseudomonas resinovorans NBRC 106553]